jgi:signal transduction histidine kinase
MRSPSKARLPLMAVFVLFIGALAAAATVVGASHEAVRLAAAGAEALAALALVLAVVYLRARYGSVMAQAAQHVAESQRLVAEADRHAAELDQQDQQRRAQAGARWAAVERAADQLLRAQLPAALAGKPVPPSLPARGSEGSPEAAALFEPVTAAVRSGVAELRLELDDQRESARLAVVTLARRVQASAHRIQEEVTRMTERHRGDADVLESGMRVDHAASQQARHAQSVAVLCGEWPGQQWPQALALVDVARAASGRIVPYQRVGVSGEPDIGACASAAEPLIHLVAELLANAAQSSPPASQVLVTVRIVQRGAVIEIDDGGVGMEDHELERARDIASGRRPAGLADLGEIPQTGLAVVGQYARRHGFGVDLMPSPYGGVRAVVLVPAGMLETLEPAGTLLNGQARAPRPAPAVSVVAPQSGSVAAPPAGGAAAPLADHGAALPAEATPGGAGLPRRHSRRGRAAPADTVTAVTSEPSSDVPAPGGPAPDVPTPAQAGAWLGAFLSSAPASHDAAPGARMTAAAADDDARPGDGDDARA